MTKQIKVKYRKDPPVRVILSTFSSRKSAERLAQGLIRHRLAACCNVLPGLSSFFIWKGKAEKEKEVLLLVKTVASRLPSALTYLKRHHPYDLPEVIVLSLEGGEAGYLKWIEESCRK